MASVRTDLEAARYLREQIAAGHSDAAGFEAEWVRVGRLLKPQLGQPSPGWLDGVEPAAIRAIGEAALPQVRLYHEASLDYGRNTMPESGLFYLGAALAQRDLAAMCRRLSASSGDGAPPLRALGGELDALEEELLAAYRPPASIDHHAEFIAASASLKEARELDAAGLRRGALLLYLQAALRSAPLRAPSPAGDPRAELRALEQRLTGPVDHTIGRLFLEMAQADLEEEPGARPAAIARDVLPRYFAALGPAPAPRPVPRPRVTVTLVRWPFT